ncbi:unnamed protein product [Heligmosomoides polygyrus]|uniref:Reverse transcriptase domain-containing protein n=1 Tax=Heligmosomoides polygyrus TaxID=6339 RepID=A0A183GKG8_HELPZ|nr:unnamed protein product [Heligmosomoides polygyrus]
MLVDLNKAFDSVETEAVVEVLLTQSVPTQYIRVLRELIPQRPGLYEIRTNTLSASRSVESRGRCSEWHDSRKREKVSGVPSFVDVRRSEKLSHGLSRRKLGGRAT